MLATIFTSCSHWQICSSFLLTETLWKTHISTNTQHFFLPNTVKLYICCSSCATQHITRQDVQTSKHRFCLTLTFKMLLCIATHGNLLEPNSQFYKLMEKEGPLKIKLGTGLDKPSNTFKANCFGFNCQLTELVAAQFFPLMWGQH